MGCRWNPIGFQFSCFMFLIITLQSRSSLSLESEGFVLLKFRARVDSDPHGTLANWNVSDLDHFCSWFGVTCVDNKVQMLNLTGCSLGGTLAPELSQLSELRSLILSKNNLSGDIPKEFATFAKLELLDLRDNKLSGVVPSELNKVLTPENLLLSGNKFAGFMTIKFLRLQSLYKVQLNKDRELSSLSPDVLDCVNRKLGYCVSRRSLIRTNKAKAIILRIKATSRHYMVRRQSHGNNYVSNNRPSYLENETSTFKRRELLEGTSNLAAMPAPDAPSPSPEVVTLVFPRSSGSFPALANAKKRIPPLVPPPSPLPPSTNNTFSTDPPRNFEEKSKGFKDVWLYVIIGVAAFVAVMIIVAVIFFCRKRAVKSIGPWKTGLSGQLQKAFVTGVPKLNRSELETACEDFSNIIEAFDGYTVYKGTLSSGVEIAVASTAILETKEWTRAMEMTYRRRIDTMSRVNHKNFVNLIGYCEEDEPFNRMMVFEYAPNGTLYEHLHDKEMEHLDWGARMRIIMGTAYCLQYMHELNPPIAHTKLVSSAIYLTDDYAAKVGEVPFSGQTGSKPRKPMSGDLDQSSLPLLSEPETNVYSFGVLMLEIISGKLSDSDEEGSITKWASKYLENDNLRDMIDPTLTTFKEEELEAICDVVRHCLRIDESQRPKMNDVVEQLKEVIKISQEQATPRLSPLWWAELEILSSEAT
ncbi:PREDICTED: protein MALE DISCOVERER 1 [Camelina sativa]|uniref:Protein MALE DISCOVERER 1 n=1 Tax=Camelina sativa TaxID=90675 RepID=A0ABM0Y363_CAMSA|nr:PREDICTED: protein MALE DISCOVERER 1 [Camelina sativa]